MSDGQTIGGVVGAVVGGVIGFYSGNTFAGIQYGWAIGSTLGAVADPQQIEGPRLQDRAIQVSSYGRSIPIIYGGDAVAGNVIWATELKETASTSGGKGGPEVTTYSYSISCAILIAEGELPALRRIWADAKLVYDASEGADEQTQMASSTFADYFTFYSGAEDQLPDPTMEAALGASNVSAYRGYCYVVFTDLPLGDYGNRLPNFRFEIGDPTGHSSDAEDEPLYDALKVYPWTGSRPVHSVGQTSYLYGSGGSSFRSTNHASVLSYATAHPIHWAQQSYSATYFSYSTSLNNRQSIFGPTYGGANTNATAGWPNDGSPESVHAIYGIRAPDAIAPLPNRGDFAGYNYGQWSDSLKRAGASFNDGKLYYSIDNEGSIGTSYLTYIVGPNSDGPFFPAPGFIGINNAPFGSSSVANWGFVFGNPVNTITATRVPAPPPNQPGCPPGDPCTLGVPTRVPGNSRFCMSCDGTISKRRAITWEVVDGDFKQLANVQYVAGALYQNGLGPVVPLSDPRYHDDVFWAAARADAIAAGTLRADVISPVLVSQVALATVVDEDEALVTSELNADLGEIVADLCARAGMPGGTYNVSALYGTVVQGYTITRQMPVRAALLPLQQCFWWDFVESGGQLRAVRRGALPVATIGPDELGASESGEPVTRVTPNRGQESELPATVTVSYPVRLASYETGTQRARRLTTRSQQEVATEFAVVMPDQHAADVADVLMYLAWTNRTTRQFSTTRKYARLEPTDLVTVNDGEFYSVLRIVERSEDGPVIKWTAVDERPAAYAPNTTPGAVVGSGGGGVRVEGPMKLLLLDTPLLRDADDGPGHYAAAGGYLPAWTSGVAFRSYDDGASYAAVREMNKRATFGYATTVLGSFAGGNMVDEANSVTVRMHYGTLATITQAELLDNGNPAMLGAELIQFKRAELVSTGVYKLTGLLRGRRGTEQHMGTHAVDDLFVLLSPTDIYRIADALADINRPAVWKGVTRGTRIADALEMDFTDTGIGMMPLSPAHPHVIALGDGGYLARWVRRTRVAGEWRDAADVALGEVTEAYDVTLLSAGGAELHTWRTSAQSLLLAGPTYSPPDAPSSETASTLPDPLMEFGAQVYLQNSYATDAICMSFDAGSGPGQTIYWLDAADLSIKEGIGFGAWRATQIASSATDIYAAVTDPISPSYLYRIEKQLPTLAVSADRTCPAVADAQGVAFDGTHVWLAETYSVKLRRLNAATLAIIDSYDYYCWDLVYDAATACLFLNSGDRVRQVDIADGSQVAEFIVADAVRARPFVVGDLLFICHTHGLKVLRISTGAVVNSMTSSVSDAIGDRAVDTGAEVAVSIRDYGNPEDARVLLFDRDSGALGRSIDTPYLQHLAGFASGGLYGVFPLPGLPGAYTSRLLLAVAGGAGGGGGGGGGAEVAAAPGMVVRVQQVSASIGRGFAAETVIT